MPVPKASWGQCFGVSGRMMGDVQEETSRSGLEQVQRQLQLQMQFMQERSQQEHTQQPQQEQEQV
jgi:hypothetical protein